MQIPIDENQSHISFGIQTGKSSRAKIPTKENIQELNHELQKIYSPLNSEGGATQDKEPETDSRYRSPSFPYIPESAPDSPINGAPD